MFGDGASVPLMGLLLPNLGRKSIKAPGRDDECSL